MGSFGQAKCHQDSSGPKGHTGGSLVSGRLQAASLRTEADGAAAVPAPRCLPWLHLLMCLLCACLTPFDFPHFKNGLLGACHGQGLTDSQGQGNALDKSFAVRDRNG